jgi:hypothetical protein
MLSKNEEDLLYAGGAVALTIAGASPSPPPAAIGDDVFSRSLSSIVWKAALPRSKSKSAFGTAGGAAERGNGLGAPPPLPLLARRGCCGGGPVVVVVVVVVAETVNLESTALESSSTAVAAEGFAGPAGGTAAGARGPSVPAWGLDWSGRGASPPFAWAGLGCCCCCCSVRAANGAAGAPDGLGPGADGGGKCGGDAALGTASSTGGCGRCCRC